MLKTIAGPTTPAARITRSHIDGTLNDRRAGGCTASSINAYRGTLCMFGRWPVQSGHNRTDPAAHLRNQKAPTPRSTKKPLTGEQLRRMFEMAEKWHRLDHTTLMLLAYTGGRAGCCREAEIVGLRWRDIDFSTNTITVYRPKVQDDHVTHMPAELVSVLMAWRDLPADSQRQTASDGRLASAGRPLLARDARPDTPCSRHRTTIGP